VISAYYGRLVLPCQLVSNGMLLVYNERIIYSGERIDFPATLIRPYTTKGYILPGFVDTHLHGGGGADFMDSTVEAMQTIAIVHCKHGTTSMCPTTVASDEKAMEKFVEAYVQTKTAGTGGADFLGLHLEGPYFASSAKGAQPERFLRVPTQSEVKRIIALGKGHIVRWDAAPELDGMKEFADILTNAGILCSMAHTDATADQASAAFEWGFSHVTHFYNVISSRRKRDQQVVDGVLEATFLNDNIAIEIIADGHHVPSFSLRLALRIKGREKVSLITDAMRAAGQNVKTSFLGEPEKGVPVIIEDGVAKLTDRSFFAGSIATMDQVLKFALSCGISLVDASFMMSLVPARLCKADHRKGSLEPGKDADFLIVGEEFNIEKVFVRGKEIL
jgi:N-acetylglucosamine-6-phosphate deacetylase